MYCKGYISSSECKIGAIKNFLEPTNIKQAQSFLGLSGYFQNILQNTYIHLSRDR